MLLENSSLFSNDSLMCVVSYTIKYIISHNVAFYFKYCRVKVDGIITKKYLKDKLVRHLSDVNVFSSTIYAIILLMLSSKSVGHEQ